MNPQSDGDPLPPGPRRSQEYDAHQQNYRFSADEMRVIKECNRESFFQRCLPLGGTFGALAYYGVKSGYFQANARFGAAPKVAIAVILGYFMGKFSYQAKCAEKLMQLPNSRVGELLRQRKRGVLRENLEPGFGPGLSLAPFSDVKPSEQYSDLGPNSIDIDTTRPAYDGLDDTHRPSMDNSTNFEEELPPVQKEPTSYEELRRKNRDDYQQKRTANYRPMPDVPQQNPPSSDPFSTPQQPPPPRTKTNKYGDAFD